MTNKTLYLTYFKRIFDLLLALFGSIFLIPFFGLIGIMVTIDSTGPVIFKQKRVGKNGQIFTMYKFRTMLKNAEHLKEKYLNLNEADGPVFKIKDDPRFTKVGKFLSHTGIDELPQLLNIIKGEMSFVGPRPLPVSEEAKIPPKIQKQRRSVNPGLVSSWLIKGAHELSFSDWMKYDVFDLENTGFIYDFRILIKALILEIRIFKVKLKKL